MNLKGSKCLEEPIDVLRKLTKESSDYHEKRQQRESLANLFKYGIVNRHVKSISLSSVHNEN